MLGIDAETAAAIAGSRAEPERFAVDEDNWPAVQLFIACSTQWERAGMSGQVTGLRYERLEAVARIVDVELTQQLFDEIRLMEGAVLDEVARRAKRDE